MGQLATSPAKLLGLEFAFRHYSFGAFDPSFEGMGAIVENCFTGFIKPGSIIVEYVWNRSIELSYLSLQMKSFVGCRVAGG